MTFLLAPRSAPQGTPEQLVEELRSPDIDVRAKARARITKLGKEAIPALENAAKDADPDLSALSKEILKDIRPR
jgi:HEAT repeat protein